MSDGTVGNGETPIVQKIAAEGVHAVKQEYAETLFTLAAEKFAPATTMVINEKTTTSFEAVQRKVGNAEVKTDDTSDVALEKEAKFKES